MIKKIFFLILLVFVLILASCDKNSQIEQKSYDVVILSATPAGIAAAIQSSRMGKSVVLIEATSHIGGLTTSGLGATDIGNKDAIGGVAKEFYHRIYLHYIDERNWVYEKKDQYLYGGERWADTECWWMFEPGVAENILNEMVAEQNIDVVLNQRLDLDGGVVMQGTKIVAIKTESGDVYKGKMFIDASYEGDLLALAGVSYTVGRESNSQYNETLNGVQRAHATHHQFEYQVDPYIVPGDRNSGLLPGVQSEVPPADGSGDKTVQAYNFRICITDVEGNLRPFVKPAGYDPARYEILLRYYETDYKRVSYWISMLPNRKTDMNNNHAFSTDNIGANYEYPEADYARRQQIIEDHYNYQMGLLWTLANHPRVPAEVRDSVSKWGLAKDEFVGNGNWPYQIYVREARRMVSDYVMTEHNCWGKAVADDAVSLAAYTMDSHNTRRYVDSNGYMRNEGDVQVKGFSPYPISYRSIIPKAGQCSNLLVPVCLSASHIAFGSIRMEPVYMILGQSAATAACLAIDDSVDVQQLDYQKLRKKLIQGNQILSWK